MNVKYWLYILAHGLLFVLGIYLGNFKNPVLSGIGSSLIATGITGWVIFIYVFVSSETAERLALIQTSGIIDVFAYRSVSIRSEYERRLQKVNSQIDIIGFGLRALREDFASEFGKWSNQAQVRILLLDPEFPSPTQTMANIRDKEEGNSQNSIENDIRAFIQIVGPLIKSTQRFEVRLYKTIPAINYFRIDDEAFWGPYLIGLQSRNTPTFLVSRSGILFQPLASHFDNIWTSSELSRPVPEDWF